MTQAKLNSDFIATVAGDITVFNYNGETREYISSSVEYLAVGVGIPANSCTDAPGVANAGFAVCRTADLTAWEYVADHRGETVYSTADRNSTTVDYIGAIHDGFTTAVPATPYDTWDGEKWVTDADALHAADVAVTERHKQALIDTAMASISVIQLKLQAGRKLTDDEKTRLNAVLDYIDAVTAVDAGAVPDISWPAPPAA